MKLENIDEIWETNQHELTHEQDIRKEAIIKCLERSKIPGIEWIFHLDNPDIWDWGNSICGTGLLNKGTEAVLSAAFSRIPLWVEPDHLAMYRKLKSKYRAMCQAD